MKITFLGSSHGIPSAERFCSCAMLEINEKLYFIDAGAPLIDLLLRNGKHPEDIKAVFCTHHHGDHTDGLLNLTDLCNWAFKNTSFDMFVTKGEQGEVIKACVAVSSMPVDTERLRFRTAAPGAVYEDENVRVTYFPTKHCEPYPSYAILVEAGDKRALFTGDLSQRLAKGDFPVYPMENETDIVVCEMAHFCREHVEPYVKALKTQNLVFNHVNTPRGMDKFADIGDMAINGGYPFSIIAVNDGDTVEL
ncbi:MAG: MBL fold metallo-hydrolase [Clostridia bacterium]|nr:MBL fold metallo-hydrolase [Clostridia bacterium]